MGLHGLALALLSTASSGPTAALQKLDDCLIKSARHLRAEQDQIARYRAYSRACSREREEAVARLLERSFNQPPAPTADTRWKRLESAINRVDERYRIWAVRELEILTVERPDDPGMRSPDQNIDASVGTSPSRPAVADVLLSEEAEFNRLAHEAYSEGASVDSLRDHEGSSAYAVCRERPPSNTVDTIYVFAASMLFGRLVVRSETSSSPAIAGILFTRNLVRKGLGLRASFASRPLTARINFEGPFPPQLRSFGVDKAGANSRRSAIPLRAFTNATYDIRMRRLLSMFRLPLLLAGCEPERGIRSDQDVQSAIDVSCVDKALRQAFGKIERWDYVSDGGTFPKGTAVAQFAYYKWDEGRGWAKLHIGSLGQVTRVSHDFTGIGSELPQASFPPALAAMAKATAAVQTTCGLNIGTNEWQEIGQEVEALN